MEYFGTVAGLDDYAAAMGITLAAGDKEPALVRASVYLGGLYEDRFTGTRPAGQFLSWPREDAQWPDGTAIAGIPDAVVYATYEAAVQELTTPGTLTPITTPGKVKKRAKVEGAVEVEYWRDWFSVDLVTGQYPVLARVESYLAGLISGRRALPGVAVV